MAVVARKKTTIIPILVRVFMHQTEWMKWEDTYTIIEGINGTVSAVIRHVRIGQNLHKRNVVLYRDAEYKVRLNCDERLSTFEPAENGTVDMYCKYDTSDTIPASDIAPFRLTISAPGSGGHRQLGEKAARHSFDCTCVDRGTYLPLLISSDTSIEFERGSYECPSTESTGGRFHIYMGSSSSMGDCMHPSPVGDYMHQVMAWLVKGPRIRYSIWHPGHPDEYWAALSTALMGDTTGLPVSTLIEAVWNYLYDEHFYIPFPKTLYLTPPVDNDDD